MYNFIPSFYSPRPRSFNNANINKKDVFQMNEISYSQNFECKNKIKKNEKCEENFLFEILGIKIFFDDILIICILLFLYEEKIEDNLLYIALILLLLS